jgi:hypothetical protein
MPHKSIAVFLAALAAALLVACGGGGSEAEDRQARAEERKAEAAIEKAIWKEFKGHDPVVCTAMETSGEQDLVRRLQPRALKYCKGGDVEEIYVRSMRIENVLVKGGSATADVAPLGNRFDRQTVRVSLKRDQAGGWEFDRILGFEDFDPRAMLLAFRDSISGVSWTTPERIFGNCLVNRFKLESPAEVKKLVMDPATSRYDAALRVCAARHPADG